MGKQSAPEAPDYSDVAAASEKSAKLQFRLGKQQLAWAKEQYAQDKETYSKIIDSFMSDMDETSKNAREDRKFYEQNFRPLEKQMVREATGYDTAARRKSEMGKAEAGVAEQYDAARENAQRDLEAYGIDPTSTRYAALDIGTRTSQAAAQAAAGTAAQQRVEDKGLALKSEAINVGRGFPGQIAQSYATSGSMGSGAGGLTGQATQVGGQTMGTAPTYMGLGNDANAGWANVLHQGYADQLAQYNANQQASSGIGSALGLMGGMAMKYFLADGGAIPDNESAEPMPDNENMEGEAGTQRGGPVPASMSPSGGEQTDDVPARLNEGEFVIPDDVVSWFGEKHFYNLIEKTAKEREEAKQRTGAIPEEQMMPPEEPVYQSA